MKRVIPANIFLLIILLNLPLFAQNSGKISGLVYADYFYNVARDTGINNLQNKALSGIRDLNGFDIRRAYLTYDHKLSRDFSSRFRLEADGQALTQNNKFGVFVKDLYIKWSDILPRQNLIFGIQPTPAFEVSESYFSYRSLEKTIMDLRGVVSSRELGVSFRGVLSENLGYWLQYGNNSSSIPETDKYKRIYAHIYYKFPYNLMATVYTDINFRKPKLDPLNQNIHLNNNIITSAFFLGYNNLGNFSMGVETFYQIAKKELFIEDALINKEALGVSVFSNFKISNKLTALGRFDFFDPAANTELKHDRRYYYLLGLDYSPAGKVSIIPNILFESYENMPERSPDLSMTARVTIAFEMQ